MNTGADLSGLDDFNVSSLLGGDKPPKDGVLVAPIEMFVEDPENARKVFNQKKLEELANSFLSINTNTQKPRGLLQPLSVTEDKENNTLIVGGGNRRLRAAKIAGLTELPYIISNELDSFDKVVDNLIREGLETIDLANFIIVSIQDGTKPGDIAKRLGKPASFISDHVIYFDMMDSIKSLHTDGKCTSMQVLAMMHRAAKKFPNEIKKFSMSDHSFTADSVRTFIQQLKSEVAIKENEQKQDDVENPNNEDTGESEPKPIQASEESSGDTGDTGASEKGEETIKNPLLLILHDEREAIIQPKKRVSYGFVSIKYQDDGQEITVPAGSISFVAVIES